MGGSNGVEAGYGPPRLDPPAVTLEFGSEEHPRWGDGLRGPQTVVNEVPWVRAPPGRKGAQETTCTVRAVCAGDRQRSKKLSGAVRPVDWRAGCLRNATLGGETVTQGQRMHSEGKPSPIETVWAQCPLH